MNEFVTTVKVTHEGDKVRLTIPGQKKQTTVKIAIFLNEYRPKNKGGMDFLLREADASHVPTWEKEGYYMCFMCARIMVDGDGLSDASREPCNMDTRYDPVFIWG